MPPAGQAQSENKPLPQPQKQAPAPTQPAAASQEMQQARDFRVAQRESNGAGLKLEPEAEEAGASEKPYQAMGAEAEPEEPTKKQGEETTTKEQGEEEQGPEDNPEEKLRRDLEKLRNAAQQRRILATASAAKQVIGDLKDVSTELARAVTAELLVQSWENLIDSFGLTLLYINFHFIAKYISSSQYFCHFGQEWKKSFSTGQGMQQLAQGAAGIGSNITDKLEYILLEIVEIGALGLLDVILLLLIAICIIILSAPLMLAAGAVILLPAAFGF